MRLREALAVLALVTVAAAAAGCTPVVARSPDLPIAGLTSPDDHARRRAADELAARDELPREAVIALYAALRKEQNPDVYGALLVALAASGIAEARPFIDARVNDPDGDTQRWARRALKKWLVRNLRLSEEDELPPPPHRLYGPVGSLPPGAPGAQAMPGIEPAR